MFGLGTAVAVLAMAIPIVAIISNGVQKIARMRLEEARLRGGGVDASAASEVSALRADVAEMRQELDELQERVDFAERALVQRRERPRLPDGEQSA